ncbi:PQQ-dependent sugar dehydrogenase [Nocardioides alcanivorans]|uniref:PQQ-dependent sugar dehydrogenase n=1 Tax=Nocardioides alcanivorans TaxID=2897352 RepID=UPI001F37FC18|nr:PQQ-dependent sugar dehydrogenase [Nocardioides alcanivorans]
MRAAAVALLALSLLAPTSAAQALPTPSPGGSTASARFLDAPARKAMPGLRVAVEVDGLETPWDVQPLPGGELLISERDRRQLKIWDGTALTNVIFPRDTVWASGETGLMSIAVASDFQRTRRIHVCHGHQAKSGKKDVRVTSYRLETAPWTATTPRTLVKGLPSKSGRHGGCRLLLARNGSLLVGTGDAAVGTNAQNLRSLGGKVLRLDPASGKPWKTNPWRKASNKKKRYVFTYGHRNVQGLAQRRDGSLWSVEHGSHRNDEVNRLRKRGNYGWNPVPGYNESVPMTDHSLPGKQRDARWSSGPSTIATSGATWVKGRKWGRLNGTLAVAALAGERLVFMKFDKQGRLKWTKAPKKLRKHGRLRSVTRDTNGDLLVTTSNGSGDTVLRISPN